jgi:murein L,D-transpeptidase YafK
MHARTLIFSTVIAAAVTASPATARARPEHVLRIFKSERKMTLEVGGETVRTFKVGLGGRPVGDKRKRGDMKTPEGELYIAWKNPASAFHRFLGLSYPMPPHAERALERGLIDRRMLERIERASKRRVAPPQDTALGGAVGIHGGGAGSDWTLGCVAVSDEEIEWLYEKLRIGDRVVVVP